MTEERKLVTVLFADIVGSTAMTGEHDAELVRATLDRAFDRVAPLVTAHGGTVEKFIGDAVMAVFGVPTAHDDDAERALRAAFQIREIVRGTTGRIPLDVRIGVNTGEAVARTDAADQRLVTGVAVNLAQRLQAAAEPGEILAGELTERLTRSSVRYATPRRIQAKGIGETVAHTAESLRDAVPEQHRGIEGLRAPLIGRDREMGLLREAYERVLAQGSPSLVTVYGTAGAGKSRLMSEFVARLDRDSVRVGRCLPYGEAITFYPLQLVIRSDAQIEPSDGRESTLTKLRERVAALIADPEEAAGVAERLAVLAGILEPRAALPDIDPADLAQELRWALRRFVERRAARSPFVLVFEDVHWAEPALLELIEHLAEWGRGPFLVLCMSRPDLRQSRPTFGSAVQNALAITLTPLAAEDTRRLVAELLAIDALSEVVRAEVITRSEGNPLYVEELLRMLIETGRIAKRVGRWVATEMAGPVEVPPTLQGLITARLDRVPAEVKRVLQAAAVAGRLFSVESLAAITGSPVTQSLLEEAVRRDVLSEADERPSGGGRAFRFRHVLFRDVAYGTIPKSERSRMHDRYGRWLEDRVGERKTEIVELLAHHAEQAYVFADEIGAAQAASLGDRALDLLIAAGDLADERKDHHAALSLFDRASAIAERIGADTARLTHVRGAAVLQRIELQGRSDETVREHSRALALAEANGPSPILLRLLIEKAWSALEFEGDLAGSYSALARLPAIADAIGDPRLRVIARWASLMAHAHSGNEEAERRLALEALEIARAAGNVAASRPLVRLGRIAARRGRLTEARQHFDEALALLPPSRSKPAEAHAEWLQADLASYFCDPAQALHFRRSLDLAAEAAIPSIAGAAAFGLAIWLEWSGDHAGARTVISEGSPWVIKGGNRSDHLFQSIWAARACVGLGALAEARAHLDEGHSHRVALRDTVRPLHRAGLSISDALLAAAEGRADRSIALFEEALAVYEGTPLDFWKMVDRIRYAEALVGLGRLVAAREQLTVAREFFSDPLALHWRARIDAVLAKCQVPVA